MVTLTSLTDHEVVFMLLVHGRLALIVIDHVVGPGGLLASIRRVQSKVGRDRLVGDLLTSHWRSNVDRLDGRQIVRLLCWNTDV